MIIYQQPIVKKSVLADPSLWFLLFSNIATIFLAINQNWNLSTILWVYWFQSVIIGFFNFIRILQLTEFSTDGLKINGLPARPTRGTKIYTAFFFLFHYGFFHVMYSSFLLQVATNFAEIKYIALTTALFFINHLFSYLYSKPRDTKKQNIGALMFYPYIRIIPMHLIVMALFVSTMFEYSSGLPLLLFLTLKTAADAAMHIVDHRVLRKGEALPN